MDREHGARVAGPFVEPFGGAQSPEEGDPAEQGRGGEGVRTPAVGAQLAGLPRPKSLVGDHGGREGDQVLAARDRQGEREGGPAMALALVEGEADEQQQRGRDVGVEQYADRDPVGIGEQSEAGEDGGECRLARSRSASRDQGEGRDAGPQRREASSRQSPAVQGLEAGPVQEREGRHRLRVVAQRADSGGPRLGERKDLVPELGLVVDRGEVEPALIGEGRQHERGERRGQRESRGAEGGTAGGCVVGGRHEASIQAARS